MNNNYLNTAEYSKVVVGVDIGTQKVVVMAAGQREDGTLNIIAHASKEHDGCMNGRVVNIDKTANAVKELLKSILAAGEVTVNDVFVSFSSPTVRSYSHNSWVSRPQQDAEITIEEIDKFLNEVYQQCAVPPGHIMLHVVPLDYSVDNNDSVNDPVGFVGAKLAANFKAIYASISDITNTKRAANRAGISSLELKQSGLASALATLSQEEMEAGVALVDIGAHNTDILIFKKKNLVHLSVLPFGGKIITKDIEVGCNILERDAERAKIMHGYALLDLVDNPSALISIPGINKRSPKLISMHNLSQIISARAFEIGNLITSELMRSGYFEQLGAGIVMTGGTSMLRGFDQIMAICSGYEVKIGYPTVEFFNGNKLEVIKHPAYATVVGLVMNSFFFLDERDAAYAQYRDAKVRTEPETIDLAKGKAKASKAKTPKKTTSDSVFSRIKDIIAGDGDLPETY